MKRTTLITLILGTTLAVAPAAHARVLSDGGSTNLSPSTSVAVQPIVTDGWTNSVSPASSYRFTPDILGGNGGVSAQPTAAGDSFEWGTLGIGAATLIGVMLLGLASLAITRRRHQHQPSF
jgi:hypothetical protein